MREILLAFIFALIIGSIINGWPRPPVKPNSSETPAPSAGALTRAPTGGGVGSAPAEPEGSRQDFPDFNSYPNVTETSFSTLVLASEKPVFIFCYSPHNLSCEYMVPLIAALAKDNADSIQMTKLNSLQNAALLQQYEINSVPTYLVFNKGELKAKLAGIVAKDKLEAILKTTQQSPY